jgi:hypothetical protein
MKDGGSATRPKYIDISAYRLFQTEVVCFERVVFQPINFRQRWRWFWAGYTVGGHDESDMDKEV